MEPKTRRLWKRLVPFVALAAGFAASEPAFSEVGRLIPSAATPVTTSGVPDPDIVNAINYLTVEQLGSGAYASENSLTTDYVATARVADALSSIDEAPAVVAAASGFLAGYAVESLEQRARRLLLTGSASDVTETLAAQNTDGGFGAAPGFASNVVDTALAVAGLRGAGQPTGFTGRDIGLAVGEARSFTVEVPGDATLLEILITELVGTVEVRIAVGAEPTPFDPFYTITMPNTIIQLTPGSGLDPGLNFVQFKAPAGATVSFDIRYEAPSGGTTEMNAATSFLLSAQNGDGGWGFLSGNDDSRLYTTYWALRALVGIAEAPGATAFVISRQATGSGFSDGGEANVFDTAVALLALVADGTDPRGLAADAVTYLEGSQLADGSFESDPYRTALAIDALSTLRALDASGPSPGEVGEDLRVDKAAAGDLWVSWGASCLDDVGDYAIYEGAIGSWYSHQALDCSDDGGDRAEVVSPGAGDHYYLVVPTDGTAAREGGYGVDSMNVERPAATTSSCVVLQVLGTCPGDVLADLTIPAGGSGTDSRIFTADASVLAQAAFFTETQIGVPPGFTHSTTGVSQISATEVQVQFQVDVAPGVTPGIYDYQVEYGLLDAASMPLGPLTDNVFDITIEVTP